MKIQFVCASFALAFLLSCSGESLPSGDSASKPSLKTQKAKTRIAMEEAMGITEEAIAFLDKNFPSESGSGRVVSSVSVLLFGDIKASALKSGKYGDIEISDTLAYVFNFKDSMGYVIVSNDKRVESPLFALTEKGFLVNGETDNPGLMIFLERLEGYALESIIEFGEADEQKLMATAIESAPPSLLASNSLSLPLISVKWGQDSPFNDDLEYGGCSTSNGKFWAGCVATAAAQIMSRWEYPTALGSTSYNWTTLKNYKRKYDFEPSPTDDIAEKRAKKRAKKNVADLFQKIGTSVSMNYDCGGSAAYAEDALSFLLSKGYYGGAGFTNYSFDIVELMTSLVPLMAKGCRSGGGCHAWVIDGYVSASPLFLVYNNWGWDGTDDGYYNSGVFNPPSKPSSYQNVKVGAVYRY